MPGDLEKARAAVIKAANDYILGFEIRCVAYEDRTRFAKLQKAVQSLNAIERQSRQSDGGRMNENSIGGKNV